MSTPPIVRPPAFELFEPGLADFYLNDLVLGHVRRTSAMPDDERRARSQQLEAMTHRAGAELALWAVPDIPDAVAVGHLHFLKRTNPFRISAHLVRGEEEGTLSGPSGANSWRVQQCQVAESAWSNMSLSAQGGALLGLLRSTMVPRTDTSLFQEGDSREFQRRIGRRLVQVMDWAAAIHARGAGSPEMSSLDPKAVTAARDRVIQSFEDYQAGVPMTLPALTAGDLTGLAMDPKPEVRALGVMLSGAVLSAAPGRGRGLT